VPRVAASAIIAGSATDHHHKCSPTEERSEMAERMAAYNQIIDEIAAEVPELRVVDSMPAVCDAKACSQKRPSGEILYSDALHLSPAGGRRLARTTVCRSL
jgi:lysophospholipase L1-like esterase